MDIQQYFERINRRFQSGISTEHSYRSDLQLLLENLCVDADVTNEPIRSSAGAPDYIITRKGQASFPIGYVEAKDLDPNLKLANIENSEQLTRYRKSLNNLILTNYIEFSFFLYSEKVTTIAIAKIDHRRLLPLTENWPAFENLIKDFAQYTGISIKSAEKLAEIMASKARVMQQVLQSAIESDDISQANSSLKEQMQAFKNVLIHDIQASNFADIYAQTIVYGLFAARLNDTTINSFTRQEAAELIPKSNPFLRKLFGYIAGVDIDDRIVWVVDALADVFRATDVKQILKDFGRSTRTEDPIIHFYETFLSAYNPKLRKSRGVWYTPKPVVNFIVRAVDSVLRSDFSLHDGLADYSKISVKRKNVVKATADKRSKIKEIETGVEIHKVQILDPAAGTGTFLAEVIKVIYSNFGSKKGMWSTYVEEHLIPRLHGFELLMASYAMAHLKLDQELKSFGYLPTKKENRLRVYLTNSLEEAHPDTRTLFANWLSQEAIEANSVKNEIPVMVVMGNPPYSGESSNKGDWIMSLMQDYKKEPGGKEKLKEKNSKWINADEYKFIRLGEHYIEKNGEGILAFINPHGFLDNPTLRGMRWRLLTAFDKIYVIDLHGNSNKKEYGGGLIDQNVFDIMQGVSINIFIRSPKKINDELAQVYHCDLYGKREEKYDFLSSREITDISFVPVTPKFPYFYFKPKDFSYESQYEKGFSLNSLFPLNGNGIVTKRDQLCIQPSVNASFQAASDIVNMEKSAFYRKYKLKEDVRDWRYEWARTDIIEDGLKMSSVQKINYRPFDQRYVYYTGKARGFIGWPVTKIMRNYLAGENVGLLTTKAITDTNFAHVFVTETMSEAIFLSSKTGSNAMNFPLYVYSERSEQIELHEGSIKEPNLNMVIINKICQDLHLEFSLETSIKNETFSPLDIFDYVYAVLHSSDYRKKYNEFLRIGYPKIPYPVTKQQFFLMKDLGMRLRNLHLLKKVDEAVLSSIRYPVDGTNEVSNIRYEGGKVFINSLQFFGIVAEDVWNYLIGGYNPVQKWLKDRKGERLSYDSVLHYQRIVAAITETVEVVAGIGKLGLI